MGKGILKRLLLAVPRSVTWRFRRGTAAIKKPVRALRFTRNKFDVSEERF